MTVLLLASLLVNPAMGFDDVLSHVHDADELSDQGRIDRLDICALLSG